MCQLSPPYQAQSEIKGLSRSLRDVGDLQTHCEQLQQDCDSMKLSLESSERIRKQQKELITLLQKSREVGDQPPNGVATNGVVQTSDRSVRGINLTPSIVDENRAWYVPYFYEYNAYFSLFNPPFRLKSGLTRPAPMI